MASVNGSNIVRMLSLVLPLSDASEGISAEEIQLFENIKRLIHGADESRTGDKGGALVLGTDDSYESDTESDSEHEIDQDSDFAPASKKRNSRTTFTTKYKNQKKSKNIFWHRTPHLQTVNLPYYRLC
ncbi:hypothetical protein L596_022144 [Steinernema carpocapsae]|uniref:Uncharacterized protein n=1 Tax=Steinernema carpocapsae TaxID=34508 RepID=A0A4U5MKU8_STECR|nr:hypothetical protein L596_022144 [Steinernema carpocapsae]